MRQHHGIKVGDLVKYKHAMFEEDGDVHLVAQTWTSKDGDGHGGPATIIVLHGHSIRHRAHNFIVISQARKREV